MTAIARPWLKLYNEAPSDPKWQMVAQRARSLQAHVWTLYSWMLVHANQQSELGSLDGFDLEVVAATTGIALDELDRIWTVFVDKLIVVGERIRAWAKRQGEAVMRTAETVATVAGRVRETVSREAERARRYRQRQRDRTRQGDLFAAENGGGASVTKGRDGVTEGRDGALRRHVTRHPPPAPPSKESDLDKELLPLPLLAEGNGPQPRDAGGRRALGINPRVEGTNPRALGTNPRATGDNPRAVQGEILLPIRGRPPPMTRRERQSRDWAAMVFDTLAKRAEAKRRGLGA